MTDDLVKRLRTKYCCSAWADDCNCGEAADRIEALTAENERLRELIKETGKHWLALQENHPIQWEGAIDAAMAAACSEIERLREALKEAHWFYLGDDCSSDQCRFGIDECISEDFEWDNPAKGDHVLQISGARPVPDMWIALHYFTDAEKDERDDDEPYAYTVHATEEAARAALGDTQ